VKDQRALGLISAAMIAGWLGMSAAAYLAGTEEQQAMVQKVWEILITLVIGFWFGSSAGKGRDFDGEG
jgi:hypothetical protein